MRVKPQDSRTYLPVDAIGENENIPAGDTGAERAKWRAYMSVYAEAIAATSHHYAPWYVIPADHKWVARTLVAGILSQTIADLPLKAPTLSPERRQALAEARKQLEADADPGPK